MVEEVHVCNYSEDWESNEDTHWKECGHGHVIDRGLHIEGILTESGEVKYEVCDRVMRTTHCGDNHIDEDNSCECDICGVPLYWIEAKSMCLGNGEEMDHIIMNPSRQEFAPYEEIRIKAPELLLYTFKGWYLLGDLDENHQIRSGKTASSRKYTYTFKARNFWTYVAVYEAKEAQASMVFEDSTDFTVTVGGEEVTGSQGEGGYMISAMVGSQVTITATEEGFLGWKNSNGKRITL